MQRTPGEAHMRRAIELAAEGIAAPGGGPFGAVIVRHGSIVAEAHNRVTACHDPTAHAEVLAIRAACQKLASHSLAGCEIYASCEPCPMCLGAVYWARLDRLYYAATRRDAQRIGFDDAHIYRELEQDVEQRALPTVQMMRREAVAAMSPWSAADADRRY